MPDYQIRFCNDLASPTGHMFHTCQREFLLSAPNEDAAIERCKRAFEREEKVSNWHLHASTIECRKLPKPRH